MPKLAWSEFTEAHRSGHLLIAVLPEEGVPGNVRAHVNLMAKLLFRQAKGNYALSVNRQYQTPQIHCAFEQETDAEAVGDGVRAELQSANGAWASQRSFTMDEPAVRTIREALDEI